MDERAHEPFREIIARIVVRPGEVLFADMVENIVNPRHHLIVRKREGVRRIKHGELGEHLRSEDVTDLELLLGIGDDRAAVHLAARADHRQDARDGHDRTRRFFKAKEVFLPRILVAVNGDGDRLGIVAHRAAADCQDQICLTCPRTGDALIELVRGGIGHDARVFGDLLAALLQNGHDPIIDPVLLDRAPAVDEQDVFAVIFEFRPKVLHGVLAEIEFRRIAIGKIPEHRFLLLRQMPLFFLSALLYPAVCPMSNTCSLCADIAYRHERAVRSVYLFSDRKTALPS